MELMEYALLNIAQASRSDVRSAITEMVGRVVASGESDLSCCPVRHFFAPGQYAREMVLPEGMVVIGKIHRHSHINVLSAGKVRVLTEYGCEEYVAPCTFVSEVGTQRVVYVLEDAVWTTVHCTTSTDLADIEKELIVDSHNELEVVV